MPFAAAGRYLAVLYRFCFDNRNKPAAPPAVMNLASTQETTWFIPLGAQATFYCFQ